MILIIIITLIWLACVLFSFKRWVVIGGELRRLRHRIDVSQVDATIASHFPDYIIYHGMVNQTPQSYKIAYYYRYEGQEYTQRHPVSKQFWQTRVDGSTVAVFCLRNIPSLARLAEDYTYLNQERSKVRQHFAFHIFSLGLLVLVDYLIWVFIK